MRDLDENQKNNVLEAHGLQSFELSLFSGNVCELVCEQVCESVCEHVCEHVYELQPPCRRHPGSLGL